tara:strand:+ start:4596 stop:4781 length:186 start_codon:yes stop_codon:yes gene_type:complete
MKDYFLRFLKNYFICKIYMKESYYKKNKENWKKGGKYYHYKPRESTGELIVKRGLFIIQFN